jgi:hypothetical protein
MAGGGEKFHGLGDTSDCWRVLPRWKAAKEVILDIKGKKRVAERCDPRQQPGSAEGTRNSRRIMKRRVLMIPTRMERYVESVGEGEEEDEEEEQRRVVDRHICVALM